MILIKLMEKNKYTIIQRIEKAFQQLTKAFFKRLFKRISIYITLQKIHFLQYRKSKTMEEFNEQGKPIDKAYLEHHLPTYLQKDIDALKKGVAENSSLLDCLLDEVYGSINSAYWDQTITEEQATYLRKKYLDI